MPQPQKRKLRLEFLAVAAAVLFLSFPVTAAATSASPTLALAAVEPCAGPLGEGPLLSPTTGSLVAIVLLASGTEIPEYRAPDTQRFLPMIPGRPVPWGSLIRCRSQAATNTVELPRLQISASQTLDLYPDTLLAMERDRIRLLRGKLRFASSAKDNPVFHLDDARIYLETGELWLGMSPAGLGKIAFRKGNGWLKDTRRTLTMLSSGQQITLDAAGRAEKPGEIDSSWKLLNPAVLLLPSTLWNNPKPTAAAPSALLNRSATATTELSPAAASATPGELEGLPETATGTPPAGSTSATEVIGKP